MPQQQAPAPGAAPTVEQLEPVKAAVRALLRQPEYDDGSAGPVLVRLAWHSAGTYCKETNTGGSNGAGMRYEKEGVRLILRPVDDNYYWGFGY